MKQIKKVLHDNQMTEGILSQTAGEFYMQVAEACERPEETLLKLVTYRSEEINMG